MVRLNGKMEVGSWWLCKASPLSVDYGGEKTWTFLRKVNLWSVYCCWQEGGKMSDTPRLINISIWLERIKVGISVPCSLHRHYPGEIHSLCVTHPSGGAVMGLLWKSLSAAGHRGDQKPEKLWSLCWDKCLSLPFYFLEWTGAGRAGRVSPWEVSLCGPTTAGGSCWRVRLVQGVTVNF